MFFHYSSFTCLLLVTISNLGLAKERLSTSCPNGVCYRNEDEGPCELKDDEPRLFRWDPVKKGHTRELELEPGMKYKMITLASKPPIFEIPGFLSSEECDHVMSMATKVGLHGSYMHSDTYLDERKNTIKGHAKGAAGTFYSWDKDFDNLVTKDEILHFARKYKFLYLTSEEAEEMIEKLQLKEFEDGKVTVDEFRTLPTAAMDEYMNDLKEKDPKHRDRNSIQSWLHQGKNADKTLKKLRKRVQKLTRLSSKIIGGSEPLQVVKYDKHGHYNAHYDAQKVASFSHLNCCHMDVSKVPNCRLCRYVTILYYLNDVEGGGNTAFPVADNATFSEEEYISSMKDDKFNLMQFCHEANLVVAPKKGQAIMWYNHFVDEKNGWLGERDDYTLHGGCGVTKGVKWIANNWITSPDFSQSHLKSSFLVDDEES